MKIKKIVSALLTLAISVGVMPAYAVDEGTVLLETNADKNILKAVYDDSSKIEWEISDSEDGEFEPVLGVSGDEYVPSALDAEKYIRARAEVEDGYIYSGAAKIMPVYAVCDEFDSDDDISFWDISKIDNENASVGVAADEDGTGYFYLDQTGSKSQELTRSFDSVSGITVIESRFRNESGYSSVFNVRGDTSPAVGMNIAKDIQAVLGNGSGSTKKISLINPWQGDEWYDIKLIVKPLGNTADAAVDIYFGTEGVYEHKVQGAPMQKAVEALNNIYFAKLTKGKLLIDYLKVFSDVEIILPEISDEDAVRLDANAITAEMLTGGDRYVIKESLYLPTEGDNGTKITWTSDADDYITSEGDVIRGSENKKVTLRATVSKGKEKETKAFSFMVLKKPNEADSKLLDMSFNTNDHGFVATPAENAVAEDGVLKIYNSSNPEGASGDVVKRFTAIKNSVFVEAEIKITSNSAQIFYLRSGSNPAVNFTLSGTTLNCTHGEVMVDGVKKNYHPVLTDAKGRWFNLKIFLDFESFAADVYADGVKVIEKVPFRFAVNSIDNMLFGKPEGDGCVYVDNLKIYEPAEDIGDIAESISVPESIETDIILPTEKDGVKISWVALENEFVSITGGKATVTRPSENEEDAVVTLVGIFETETAVEAKEYELTVKRERTDKEAVDDAKAAFIWECVSDEEIDKVKNKLNLPKVFRDGVNLSYSFDNEEAAAEDRITRPASEDAVVEMTVVFERGSAKDEKKFTFTVLKLEGDAEVDLEKMVDEDLNEIDLGKLSDITDDITLPQKGDNGSAFTWKSSNSSVIDEKGEVTRASSNKSAYLTVTATLLDKSAEKSFYVTVKGKKGTSGGSGSGGSSGGGSSGGGGWSGGSFAGVTSAVKIDDNLKDEKIFKDTSTFEWAESAIEALVKKGVVAVNEDKTFEPSRSIKREEAVKMIVTAFDIPDGVGETGFSDVERDKWYYSYLLAAEKNGIINGIDENIFGVAMNVTRQDAAVILFNAVKDKLSEEEDKPEFVDSEEISGYAKAAIGYFAKKGIINGYEDNTFKPKNTITRAEFAVILAKLVEEVR